MAGQMIVTMMGMVKAGACTLPNKQQLDPPLWSFVPNTLSLSLSLSLFLPFSLSLSLFLSGSLSFSLSLSLSLSLARARALSLGEGSRLATSMQAGGRSLDLQHCNHPRRGRSSGLHRSATLPSSKAVASPPSLRHSQF